jgi:hypothetical protein
LATTMVAAPFNMVGGLVLFLVAYGIIGLRYHPTVILVSCCCIALFSVICIQARPLRRTSWSQIVERFLECDGVERLGLRWNVMESNCWVSFGVSRSEMVGRVLKCHGVKWLGLRWNVMESGVGMSWFQTVWSFLERHGVKRSGLRW